VAEINNPSLTMDQIQSALIADTAPLAEATAGAIGTQTKAQAMNHQHPRLSSVTAGTLNASGLSGNMTFTRQFATQPGVFITAITPGGTQPIVFQVETWIMSGPNFAGCTIKGFRLQENTLAAVTVLGISVAVGGATVTPSSAPAASGVNFSLIAVAGS